MNISKKIRSAQADLFFAGTILYNDRRFGYVTTFRSQIRKNSTPLLGVSICSVKALEHFSEHSKISLICFAYFPICGIIEYIAFYIFNKSDNIVYAKGVFILADNNKNKTTVKPVTTANKPIASRQTTQPAKPASTAKPVSARATANAEKRPTSTVQERSARPTTAQKTAQSRTASTETKPTAAEQKRPVARTVVTDKSAKNEVRPAPANSVRSSAKDNAAHTNVPTRRAVRSDGAREVAAAKNSRVAADTAHDKKSLKDSNKSETNVGKNKSGKSAAKTNSSVSKRNRIIIIAVAVVLAFVICLTVILVSCKNDGPVNVKITPYKTGGHSQMTRPSDNAFVAEDDIEQGSFTNNYKNRTKVGYHAEYLGTVPRNIPTETHDGGLPTGYPVYGKGLNLSEEQKVAIISENWTLCTINTRIGSDGYPKNTYNKIDRFGKLYLNGEYTGRDLYKHTGAVGLYRGNVADDEPAISKKFTYMPRGYDSYNVTGMYAPAGEIITVELSASDMESTGGIAVHIGQALYNNKANNIWKARGFNRMPVILNTFILDKNTCTFDSARNVYIGYVGSFFGGPIYVCNENVTFSVTVSGGVRYAHYILGYTTPEEYAENLSSTAPYFDLEVRNFGVLHSGPKSSAGNTSYDNIYNAAVLWEKISLVSTQRSKQGIVFIYDTFVAAGAAVAFPGQRAVNCPDSWMSNSLNYNSFVNGGAWGNAHEYNHNFQGYGCNGNDGEVTNNAISLVEYSLFTNISSHRQMGGYGGSGLSGWNCYTSATWALNKVNKGDIGGTNGLAMYATLLHNLGQEAFMSASLGGRGVNYFQKWGDVTHQNMTYFLELAKTYSLSGNGNDYSSLKKTQKSYPMFVPVSSVYQTGRSYMYDGQKKYITTMRPYTIKHGENFEIDMRPYTENNGMYTSGSVVLPKGFSYTVKKVMAPKYGKLTKKSNNTFVYTPDPDHDLSGKMIVTIGITKNDGAFKVDDVDLVLEFKQSYEMNKNVLERTVYTFEEGKTPESATAAFESDYAGYSDKETVDNVNPVQNGNTEIWSKELLPDNTFYEIKGKIRIGETAKYRIALRGRWDCALYTSVNKDADYTRVATVKTDATHANFYNDPTTYHDFAQLEAGDWLYFKAVLKSTHKGGTNAFIGVGFGQFVPPQGTLDEDGNLVDGNGNIIENPEETINITYANAYRANYEEVIEEFTSEYFYVRKYEETNIDIAGTPVITDTNYRPWTDNVAENWYDISHLFDGKSDTWIHTAKDQWISASNPLYFDVDMGKSIKANKVTINGWTEKSMDKIGFPKSFTFEFFDADGKSVYTKAYSGISHSNKTASLELGASVTFKSYKLTVTETDNGRCALTSLVVFNESKGVLFEPDNEMFKYDGAWSIKSGPYTFGHIYEGKNGATLRFKFIGNTFAIYGNVGPSYGGFDVYIDGEKADTVTLSGDAANSKRVYTSSDLGDGSHIVEIKCNNGSADIDGIALWK